MLTFNTLHWIFLLPMEIAILSTIMYHLMAKYAGVELLLVITTVNFKSLNIPIIRQWFAKWNSLEKHRTYCKFLYEYVHHYPAWNRKQFLNIVFSSLYKCNESLNKAASQERGAQCCLMQDVALIVYLHAGVCITLVIVTEKYSFTMQHRLGNKILIGVVRTQRRQLSSSSDFHITSSQAHSAHQNRREGECLQSLFLHLIRLFSMAKFIRSVLDTRRG